MSAGNIHLHAIEASRDTLRFRGTGLTPGSSVAIYQFPPCAPSPDTVQALPDPVALAAVEADGAGFAVTIPRAVEEHDRLFNAFRLASGEILSSGVCHVTDMKDIAATDWPYPRMSSIKGLQVRMDMVEDAVKLGVRHAAINLNQGDIMLPGPGENVTVHTVDGRVFYFDEAYMVDFDKTIKTLSDNGINVSLILLNSPNWKRPIHPEMKDILLHPRFNTEGFISAFNMTNAEGLAHYRAFVSFAAERYSRPDQLHGRVTGYIVGNEIDSQWVWGNSGDTPIEQYIAEYTLAMRYTWYAARQAYAHARVYISLDHLWTIRHIDNPLRTYPSRQCLELLNQKVSAEGDFGWGVAFHPYPEDLRYPDFWNDATAPPTIDAPRITFRNIEQLPAFLSQPVFLHGGRQRPIILSEQGFNSMGDPESEAFQAAAYALAFRKVAACPTIESFILHAHVDNLHEFGLNLGLWRIDGEGNPTTPKPAYDVFRDIDGPNGDAVYEQAKPFLARAMNRGGDQKLF